MLINDARTFARSSKLSLIVWLSVSSSSYYFALYAVETGSALITFNAKPSFEATEVTRLTMF